METAIHQRIASERPTALPRHASKLRGTRPGFLISPIAVWLCCRSPRRCCSPSDQQFPLLSSRIRLRKVLDNSWQELVHVDRLLRHPICEMRVLVQQDCDCSEKSLAARLDVGRVSKSVIGEKLSSTHRESERPRSPKDPRKTKSPVRLGQECVVSTEYTLPS